MIENVFLSLRQMSEECTDWYRKEKSESRRIMPLRYERHKSGWQQASAMWINSVQYSPSLFSCFYPICQSFTSKCCFNYWFHTPTYQRKPLSTYLPGFLWNQLHSYTSGDSQMLPSGVAKWIGHRKYWNAPKHRNTSVITKMHLMFVNFNYVESI